VEVRIGEVRAAKNRNADRLSFTNMKELAQSKSYTVNTASLSIFSLIA